MKSVTGKDFATVLERKGWELLSIAGQYHFYGKPGIPARISLPMHGDSKLMPVLQSYYMEVAELIDGDLK